MINGKAYLPSLNTCDKNNPQNNIEPYIVMYVLKFVSIHTKFILAVTIKSKKS